MFSERDFELFEKKGITPGQVRAQLERFKKGFPSIKLTNPATIGNGIKRLSEEEATSYTEKYDQAQVNVIKFVPASGAATRMFKSLFQFLEQFDGTREKYDALCREEKKIGKFFTELDEFAFYKDLKHKITEQVGNNIEEVLIVNKHDRIVDILLNNPGLNYGQLPKGLLKFHQYDSETRTPAQEHLSEGFGYANKKGGVKIHFTVSPEHLSAFKLHIDETIEKRYSTETIDVSFSTQRPQTDTVAATQDHQPFRSENSDLLFRPAGHGALLENLNDLDSDIIFIKNIDNVVPDRIKEETKRYKKALAGVLLGYQEQIFSILHQIDQGRDVFKEAIRILEELGSRGKFSNQEIFDKLNRPIRVCGMVKNEGEQGGGPFWVEDEFTESLQIVESVQINKGDSTQKSIFKSSTHFNPVDLVCGVKDYKGKKFDLTKYRNEETGFISEKTYNGQKLLAMELPGLWNGSMAYWNTIFVEVPLITFNPVKTVIDLLKPTHR